MENHTWMPKEEDVSFFEEQGYWVSPKVISDERLEQLRISMNKVYNEEFETGKPPWQGYWRTGDNPKALRKTDNSHWSDLVIRGLATDPIIGEMAAHLMKADSIRLWHDQLLYKPGRGKGKESTNVGWHQDRSYWRCTAEPSLLTAWVAFDDVDLSNGCMQVVPRSHKWGLVNVNDFFEQDMKKQEENMDVPEGEVFSPTPIVMKAGQVSFHHCLTIHGSGRNTTDHPRRSLAIHLMTGDTHYKSGKLGDRHMNVELLKPKEGDLFAGEWFPVLYEKY